MISRAYGSTGTMVSALGFGGMRFENTDDPDACASLVKACYDRGITYFDTAIGYGKSEEVMGLAFKEMNRTRAGRPFYVATKTFSATPGDIRRDAESSLKRLQVDAIDFYHMWCVSSLEAYRERKLKGALTGFEKLKEEGLVRHICVSSHMNGDEIGEMLRDYPFEGALLGHSAMNFAFREAALEAAAELGRGVVAMNPLGGGIIPRHADRFSFVKSQPGETVTEGALRFLFNDPRVTVTLVGMSNMGQLDEAMNAMDGFQPLAPAAVARIRTSLQESFDEMCTSCSYCDDCPSGLPLPKLMESYNHYMLSGNATDMINRLNWHWSLLSENNGLGRCTECGACEKACTQKLPIIDRLKTIGAEIARYQKEAAEKKK